MGKRVSISEARIRLGCLQLAVEMRTGQQTVDELTSVASQFFDWCKAGQRLPEASATDQAVMPAKKRGRPRRNSGFSPTA